MVTRADGRSLHLIAAAAAELVLACSGSSEPCQRAFRDGDFNQAAQACAERYERTGELTAGVRAAQAERKRGLHQQVIAWAEKLGDAPEAAVAWRGAAGAHQILGDVERSKAAHLKALALYARAGTPGEAAYHALVAMDLHWKASRLLDAFRLANRGVELAYQSDDREMRLGAFTRLFTMLHDIGDHRSARALLERLRDRSTQHPPERAYYRFYEGLLHDADERLQVAGADYRSALFVLDESGVEDATLRRSLRLNLASVQIRLRRFAEAEAQLAEAKRELASPPPAYSVSSQAFHEARLAFARDRFESAVEVTEKALSKDPIIAWKWRLEDLRGRALERLKRPEAAIDAFERAISVVESMRSEVELDDFRYSLLADKRAPYESLFILHARAGRVEAAMSVAERARARAFVDALMSGDPEGLGVAYARLASIEALNRGATRRRDASDWSSVRRALGDRVIVSFFRARDRVWRYLQTGQRRSLDELSLSADKIAAQVRAVQGFDSRAAPYDQLGKTLFEGIRWPDADSVYVVTDDALGRVPFAAVRVKGRALIERSTLSFVPSLTTLAAMITATMTSSAAPAIVAWQGNSSGTRPQLAVQQEAVLLSKRMPTAKLALGQAATAAALRSAAGAALLHISAHGALSSQGAHLELADGPVYAGAIVAWRVRPDVAVVATCASAARPTHGLWGTLGGAFLAAGSRTVIGTLRTVPDDLASRFVSDLYEAKVADEPVRALARVQRRWIADGHPPSDWAPYVALGLIR